MPQIEYDPEKGELVVYDANNAPHIVQVPRNEAGEPVFPFTVEDSEGKRYQIEESEDGTLVANVINGQIDNDAGRFNNTLTGEDLEKFNEVIAQIRDNCLGAALLNSIDGNSGINIETRSINSPGAYNPRTHTITLRQDGFTTSALMAELFHAYQEQFYGGRLTEIVNDRENNYIGGSNIEFEEKAMLIASSFFDIMQGNFSDTQLLYFFLFDLFENNPNYDPITINDIDMDKWFEALNEFRDTNIDSNNLYGTPVDTNLLPTALIDLLNKAFENVRNNPDCNKTFRVTPNI
jgi:Fe-S-cluster formation regulator IscX/YfhJ